MTRADLVVVTFALLLLPYLYISFWGESTMGEEVHVLVNGKQERIASLTNNQELTIQGALGPSIIKVENGRVRFSASPCNNKQCIHSGWLQLGGEFTACLPNRVSLLVKGLDNRFDTINF